MVRSQGVHREKKVENPNRAIKKEVGGGLRYFFNRYRHIPGLKVKLNQIVVQQIKCEVYFE